MDAWPLILAPAGTIGLVALSWCLGGWRNARITDASTAVVRLAQDEPTFQTADTLLSHDHRAALLADRREIANASLAAVTVLGDKFVSRRLTLGSVRAVAVSKPDAQGGIVVRIKLSDHTFSRIDMCIEGRQTANIGPWVSALEGLVRNRAAATSGRPVNRF